MDSSWGGEPGFGRRSRSGIFIKYGNAPIYAASILEKGVTLSSTEAEYVALSEATKTITWLRRVLNEIGIAQAPSVVYQDNIGSIRWAESSPASEFSKRKHVDIRYHYVREKLQEKAITLRKVSTRDMQSDFLTKPLEPGNFKQALAKTDILTNQSDF